MELIHLPFAFSLLPFLAVGIGLPVTLQDWYHGRLLPGDGLSIVVGVAVVGAWEWAILWSIKSKQKRGETRLLGRELSSWYWAPPITFLTGVGVGLIFLGS